jgi:glycosyltransferase involved in cell wall biosynthesis
MKIFLDVTRLVTRILRNSPSGIDRVEYAYAKHLLETDDTVCVFTAPVFAGALRRSRALDILSRVERAWRLDATPEQDPNFVALRAWLDSPINRQAARPIRIQTAADWRSRFRDADFFPLRDILRAETRLARWMSRNSEEPAIFFHCSHAQLHKPNLFKWIETAGLRSAFFMHDAIPIDFPEFCSPGSFDRHVLRLTTVSSRAALVIVNSRYSGRTIEAALKERGARVPEIEVVPLAVGAAFAKAKRAVTTRPAIPYFLFVGNIEPRKNILFLLEVWRRLVERLGARAPRLVIAGRRGWENENIVDVLERSRVLAPFVAEASDLTDASLARLMADAAGLVAPSFTEGFSLPVVESLAVGTPVVASDIAAHHEIGEGYAIFADPTDGPTWVGAIEALMDDDSDLRRERVAKIAGYTPFSWEAHVSAARHLMERCARRVDRRSA